MEEAPLWKILVGDRAILGSQEVWSLPDGDKPGEWHSIFGDNAKSVVEFGLTESPAQWWIPGSRIYLTEERRECGGPFVRYSCRLRREATPSEMRSSNSPSETPSFRAAVDYSVYSI